MSVSLVQLFLMSTAATLVSSMRPYPTIEVLGEAQRVCYASENIDEVRRTATNLGWKPTRSVATLKSERARHEVSYTKNIAGEQLYLTIYDVPEERPFPSPLYCEIYDFGEDRPLDKANLKLSLSTMGNFESYNSLNEFEVVRSHSCKRLAVKDFYQRWAIVMKVNKNSNFSKNWAKYEGFSVILSQWRSEIGDNSCN